MVRSPSRAEIVVRLAKVVELVLSDLGLTENQYRALTLIDEGAPPLREFAIRLAMQPPNLTTLIDALVRRELVARERHPDDGRRIVLHLTVRGQALLARANKKANQALARVASFDAPHERALLEGIDSWHPALQSVAADLRNSLTPAPRNARGA
jgi:DNA-binding MarR family transcriptional regulator